MKNLFLFTLSLLISSSCFAITITWNGGTGKWTRASKWTPAQVPGPNDRVIIPSGNVYILNPTAAINSLSIQANASLYIEQGRELQVIGSTNSYCIENHGTINNYGTLNVLGGTSPFRTGIYNARYFFNRPSGTLLIRDMWRGFTNTTVGYANNEGSWTIDIAASSGVFNQGDFVSLSEIIITDCHLGFFNEGLLLNQALLSIDQSTTSCIFNRGTIDNTNLGEMLLGNTNGFAIDNQPNGTFENNGGVIQFDNSLGSRDLINQGEFYNLSCGELYFRHPFSNVAYGLIHNESWIFSTSTMNHSSGSNATFINNGVIHDPEDSFVWVVVQNNGIIVKPIPGPIYVNQAVPNALGLGSLNGFVVDYWVDPNLTTKVGYYDENTNEFIPNNEGVGLTEIKVLIGFGSCGNRYLTIPIPGGIQNPPSPFAIPDGDQNPTTQDIQLYPNPAQDLVMITLPDNQGEMAAIQILDAVGKQVYSLMPKDQTKTFSFSVHDFPAGLYWISILMGNGDQSIKKLIVE